MNEKVGCQPAKLTTEKEKYDVLYLGQPVLTCKDKVTIRTKLGHWNSAAQDHPCFKCWPLRMNSARYKINLQLKSMIFPMLFKSNITVGSKSWFWECNALIQGSRLSTLEAKHWLTEWLIHLPSLSLLPVVPAHLNCRILSPLCNSLEVTHVPLLWIIHLYEALVSLFENLFLSF